VNVTRQLQEDLSPGHYDLAVAITAAGDPPKFKADPVADYKNHLYFGWQQDDLVRATLIRMNSYLTRLIDRYFERARFLGLPVGRQRRYDEELKKVAVAISDAQPARKVAVQRWAHSRGIEETDIEVNLAVAQQTLRTLQEDQGLTEPFAALLETYFIPFTSTGSNSVTSALTGTNNKNQTFAAGFLSFESDHLRTRKIPFGDLSFGGRIGISPTETLVTVAGLTNASTGTPDNKPKAFLQNAFNWRLNVRVKMPLGRRSEASPLFSWGQNILVADTSAVGPAPPNTTTLFGGNTQMGHGFGRPAWNIEFIRTNYSG
jgi:hypothetical protein